MANVNKVILIGNLTRDPELRVTPKGTPLCSFGLAINRTFKDEAGQSRDETTFVDIDAWGKQGELIAKYCTKGRPLYVEGRLKFDQWEDKTSGQKRSKLKIVLENFQFLGGARPDGSPGGGSPGGPSDEGGDQSGGSHVPPPRPGAAPRPAAPSGPVDEDVPF
jgi:single-strand DNA-binding protein